MNMKTLLGILALAAVTAGSAAAAPAESIRLGVISTTTGPLAAHQQALAARRGRHLLLLRP